MPTPDFSTSKESRLFNNWEKLKLLGEGGQGKVWMVRKSSKMNNEEVKDFLEFSDAIRSISEGQTFGRQRALADKIRSLLVEISCEQHEYGALKVLHPPAAARDSEKASARIAREVDAMQSCDHPSLLRILEVAEDKQSYVSEFHTGGVLTKRLADYSRGNAIVTLTTIRSLVEGLEQVHSKRFVHRDIKPDNIFLGDRDRLVLGDFGLIFHGDSDRLSKTHENVGSRDWMPPWTSAVRAEEIKPNFDVYSIGKVIWSMLSGKPVLRLWYWNRPENNLEKLFPGDPAMQHVNALLSKTVVEDEASCIENASSLHVEIDRTIRLIEFKATRLHKNVKRACLVCGEGTYDIITDRDLSEIHNFGLHPAGISSFRVYSCSACGHVQLFACETDKVPAAWDDLRDN